MQECHGNGNDHCCYLGSVGVCRYLEEGTVDGRRWACGLFRRAGSWDAVYESVAYRDNVRPVLDRLRLPDCGDWPQNDPATMEQGIGLCCWQTDVEVVI